jgi:hypothetical protein
MAGSRCLRLLVPGEVVTLAEASSWPLTSSLYHCLDTGETFLFYIFLWETVYYFGHRTKIWFSYICFYQLSFLYGHIICLPLHVLALQPSSDTVYSLLAALLLPTLANACISCILYCGFFMLRFVALYINVLVGFYTEVKASCLHMYIERITPQYKKSTRMCI